MPFAGPKANTSAKCTIGNISALLSAADQGPDPRLDGPQEDSTPLSFDRAAAVPNLIILFFFACSLLFFPTAYLVDFKLFISVAPCSHFFFFFWFSLVFFFFIFLGTLFLLSSFLQLTFCLHCTEIGNFRLSALCSCRDSAFLELHSQTGLKRALNVYDYDNYC